MFEYCCFILSENKYDDDDDPVNRSPLCNQQPNKCTTPKRNTTYNIEKDRQHSQAPLCTGKHN